MLELQNILHEELISDFQTNITDIEQFLKRDNIPKNFNKGACENILKSLDYNMELALKRANMKNDDLSFNSQEILESGQITENFQDFNKTVIDYFSERQNKLVNKIVLETLKNIKEREPIKKDIETDTLYLKDNMPLKSENNKGKIGLQSKGTGKRDLASIKIEMDALNETIFDLKSEKNLLREMLEKSKNKLLLKFLPDEEIEE